MKVKGGSKGNSHGAMRQYFFCENDAILTSSSRGWQEGGEHGQCDGEFRDNGGEHGVALLGRRRWW
jgi:hypothetical protein